MTRKEFLNELPRKWDDTKDFSRLSEQLYYDGLIDWSGELNSEVVHITDAGRKWLARQPGEAMNPMQQVADWLEEYGQHIDDCDFRFISAWEPDRGFKVRGVWQRAEPRCGCGYHEALKQAREWADNPEAKS